MPPRPKSLLVLNTLRDDYEQYNSNVHQGVHTLSATTDAYGGRTKLALQPRDEQNY